MSNVISMEDRRRFNQGMEELAGELKKLTEGAVSAKQWCRCGSDVFHVYLNGIECVRCGTREIR